MLISGLLVSMAIVCEQVAKSIESSVVMATARDAGQLVDKPTASERDRLLEQASNWRWLGVVIFVVSLLTFWQFDRRSRWRLLPVSLMIFYGLQLLILV